MIAASSSSSSRSCSSFAQPLQSVLCGVVTTVAGSGNRESLDGVGIAAGFNYPAGIVKDWDGKMMYVADCEGHKIRSMCLADGAVTTLAGNGDIGSANGVGAAATFNGPTDVAIGLDGKMLYVADQWNLSLIHI